MKFPFSFFVLFLPYYSLQQVATIIDFDRPYSNISTIGGLIPNLYELPKPNGTERFAVNVFVYSEKVRKSQPISVVLVRGAASLSTVLPRIQTLNGVSKEYSLLAETLCEDLNSDFKPLTEFNETVRVSISSSFPATFSFKVSRVYDFEFKMKKLEIVLTPSTPVFFRFSFPPLVNEIAIRVTSYNDVCGRIIIQSADCPVFDTEGQVVLYDLYNQQTFTKRAFIIVKREEFGEHIHVIFSVLPTDIPCLSNYGEVPVQRHDDYKNLTLEINSYNPNTTSIYAVIAVYIVVIILFAFIAWLSYSKSNNFNPEDQSVNGTYHFWNLSLAQLFVILPVAMIVISIKYAYSVTVTDTDTCNFNFECAINLGSFHAFNHMLSASSIAVAAVLNIIISFYIKRFRRFFPLNSCIFLTGVLWTLMNICPQRHSFHLFTMSVIMTVLEAKFLLFGMRVGRKLMNYKFTGSFMAISMFWVILDTNLESFFWNIVFCALTVTTNLIFAVYFTYAQGNQLFNACCGRQNFVSREYARTTSQQSEHVETTGEIEADGRPSTSESFQELIPGENRSDISERNSSRSTSTTRNRTTIVFFGPNQILLNFFAFLSLSNIVAWAIYGFYAASKYDARRLTLRILQTDFALYFVFYCFNKIGESHFLRFSCRSCVKTCCFWFTTMLFVCSVVFWWWVSTYQLPSYVPWSPAASRTLNSSCLSDALGMDYQDLLHYTSMLICFFYPLMIHKIDQNLELTDEPLVF